MLRRFLDYQLKLAEPGKPLHKIKPLISAGDTFLYEAPINTKKGPHIRDAVDIKRWMILVVVALIPCILMAIWNTGIQNFVYSSGDYRLMNEFLDSLGSVNSYLNFALKDSRYLSILWLGFSTFIPIAIVSYAVGGICEALFACARGHEISEGFLVTGILYALILPPTIPYWMTAVGVAAGVVLGKEVFGGSGMNIVNPAMACRAFLFFTFPGRMTGNVWVGSNPTTIRESLVKMNQDAGTDALDAYTQATRLNVFNVPPEIKKLHIDAIATNNLGNNVATYPTIQEHFTAWHIHHPEQTLGSLSLDQLRNFVTAAPVEGGLGLSPGYFDEAYHFSALNYGIGPLNSDWGFFLGNKLGSMGETSTLACLLGAIFLIVTGIASWRIMLAVLIGAFAAASAFEWGTKLFAEGSGAYLPAEFGFPAYKHLLLGGLAFGLVFMATDPVSSPSLKAAKWIYGIFIGVTAIVIRVVNPAYPEGMMLAVLMGNVFAPLIDYYATLNYRKRRTKRVRAAPKEYSPVQTIVFMVVLSIICAVILSILASALAEPKELAKDLDRSKQMMIAAKIFDPEGYFILQENGRYVPAKYDNGILVPADKPVFATNQEIHDIYQKRLIPFLTNDKGEIKTFEELGIEESKYLSDFRKSGYYREPWKLFYEIMPNGGTNREPIGYVFPVNGYGLWDAIYGYIAIAPDADTVIGISWYDQKETPGLGANITEAPWQNLFPGKKIFLESPDGSTDFKKAPLGITVVKGKVSEVLGDSPKAKSAVDGMAGATLTGNGVTDAYKNVLSSYRPLFLKLQAGKK